MNRFRRPGRRPVAKEVVTEAQGTLSIESIASGGEGVGRVDGLACFVPRTAPGDRVQVAYVTHARHARGRVLQVLDESSLRTEPRCHHYVQDRCGGCQLQHLTDDAQRDARRAIVRDALQRIGKRRIELPELTYGESWAYRGRLTLTLLRRGSGWIGGLHPYDDASRVFALTECPIAHPALVAAWLSLAPVLRGLPDARSLRLGLRLTGDVTHAVVREGERGAVGEAAVHAPRLVLVVEGGDTWHDGRAWAEHVMRAHAPIRAVWWNSAAGMRSLQAGDADSGEAIASEENPVNAQPSATVDDLAPESREAVEALAFAQVNSEVASALHAFVREQVMDASPASVIDGYAGIGLLSEELARAGVRVTAIESDPAATARARERLAAVAGASNDSTVVTDTMERGLAAALPADVVVLNPPRRGVDGAVTSLLADAARRGVRRIVYVSCDPATLARDLTRLPAWSIRAVRCFDMFPQTAHVETVCVLVPEGS